MKWFSGMTLVTVFLAGTAAARADEQQARAAVDKAIKAAGGEEKFGKATILSWKSKGTVTFNGEERTMNLNATAQGLDHYRSEFEGEFNGNPFKAVTVLSGDKGWRRFGDNARDMDDEAVAREKRNVYLNIVPIVLVPLKGKDFKLDSAADEQVNGKPAVAVKATGPDGKTFTLCFDKESGLPVKMTATVAGFNGEDYEQETTFADYKDFDGVKKATKLEMKRNGERFVTTEITEFKVLDKVEPGTFDEPK
jgi:hypothetical protein